MQDDESLEALVRENCACLRARMAARKLTRIYDKTLKPTGLRITQFTLLIAIKDGRTKSVSALADLLAMERTTLLRNLKVLEEAGLVTSEPSGEGRALSLKLTPTGETRLSEALPYWQAAQRAVETELGDDWPVAKSSLEQVIRDV